MFLILAWSGAEKILEAGKTFWRERGIDFETAATAQLRTQLDANFMTTVDANLAANKMRLIIAGDGLPAELVRVIEFLHETSKFDVLGLEIRLLRGTDGVG